MRLDIDPEDSWITLIREPGEPAVKDESQLFYRLKKTLQAMGEDVIKKLMWKDGHLVDDRQHYVRSRNLKKPHAYAIHDPEYAVRDAAEKYNRGEVDFQVVSLNEGEPHIGPYIYEGPLEWYPS